MNCPKCSKPTFKKYNENTETHYYYCSTCRYETLLITKINDHPEKKYSAYHEKLIE